MHRIHPEIIIGYISLQGFIHITTLLTPIREKVKMAALSMKYITRIKITIREGEAMEEIQTAIMNRKRTLP